LVGGLV